MVFVDYLLYQGSYIHFPCPPAFNLGASAILVECCRGEIGEVG